VRWGRTSKQKHVEVPFFLQRRAPIPRAREATVDAAPRIVEIIRTAPVKRMAEKVAEDVEVKRVKRAVLRIYICAQRRRSVQRRELYKGIADREEDAINLRVLVCAGPSQQRVDLESARARAYR
jgi:hypothetical protein